MKKLKIILFFVISITFLFVISCKKENKETDPSEISEPGMPKISTSYITEITETSAICGGNITDQGDELITSKGVIWGTYTNVSMDNKIDSTNNGIGNGIFISNITELEPNTTYYVRAYASNNNGQDYSYGEEKVFQTEELSQNSITITKPSNNKILDRGSKYYIKWTSVGVEGNLRISLYKGAYNGSSVDASDWYKTITDIDCSTGQYRWTVSNDINPDTYTLYLSPGGIHAAITIKVEVPDYLDITSPTSSSQWGNGYHKHIKWESSGAGDNVKIELYYKASNGYESLEKNIANSTDNDGDYYWGVDTYNLCSGCYRIKVISISKPTLYDYSDYFSVF